jgi:hypothetical protein
MRRHQPRAGRRPNGEAIQGVEAAHYNFVGAVSKNLIDGRKEAVRDPDKLSL